MFVPPLLPHVDHSRLERVLPRVFVQCLRPGAYVRMEEGGRAAGRLGAGLLRKKGAWVVCLHRRCLGWDAWDGWWAGQADIGEWRESAPL